MEETADEATPAGKARINVPAADFVTVGSVTGTESPRFSSGIAELDRVLGGGIVVGSYLLLAGEPGAGKSTLTTEVLIKGAREKLKVGLVTGEESKEQARMRVERLGGSDVVDQLLIASETSAERIITAIESQGFDILVVDSIQTVFSEQIPGAPGSISQLRGCGHMLMNAAKATGTTVILTGQVNKDNDVAGPRALEHAVDAFLMFEGDRREQIRILRSMKNRFGSTDEIGLFEMTETGLVPVTDAAGIFCPDDDEGQPGAAICVAMQGSRPVLCQVEALVNPSNQPMPVRSPHGIDNKRLQKLLAVLSRKCGIRVGSCDVFVSVAGGLKIDEPAVDLAICLAVASAYLKRPVKERYACFGEVSLRGSVRTVSNSERRKKEAERMEYTAFGPSGPLSEIIDQALSAETVEEPTPESAEE
jgi:DNA repair protein RadA/Sms